MKYSWEFKMKCVEKYLKGGAFKKPESYGGSQHTFESKLSEWTRKYKLHGVDGLKNKSTEKEWTQEDRYELVVQVLAGKSYREVADPAGVDGGLLYQWVRRYKQFGYEGLKLRKGRKPKEPDMSKENKAKELTKSEREELVLLRRQNEYLRAENAYLKKLRALIVQKQAESSVKAKKQPSSEDSEQKDTD